MVSFFSVLEDAACELPDKRVFVFPETRSRSHIELTYRELAVQSAAAGRAIADAAKLGERALLLFPTGPDFWTSFMGCLRQGIIAVPLHTPNVNRRSEMLQAVCPHCSSAAGSGLPIRIRLLG